MEKEYSADYFDYKIGGLFKTYKEYLNSNLWKEKRQEIIEVLGRKCARCKTTFGIMNIHHLNYERVTNEHKEDVIVLCESCHKNEHNIK